MDAKQVPVVLPIFHLGQNTLYSTTEIRLWEGHDTDKNLL